MKITTTIRERVEKIVRDEDWRQDIYLKLLEMPEPTEAPSHGQLTIMYRNLLIDSDRVRRRREEILEENNSDVACALGFGTQADDPAEVLQLKEKIVERLLSLSELQKRTLERLFLDGLTPEELAAEEGVERNAIDQRVHTIKTQLRGLN